MTSPDPIFIFSTTDSLSYITAQFIQGAIIQGASVTTNCQSLHSDGRHLKPDLTKLGIKYRLQPTDSELVFVDESRIISQIPDLNAGFFENLKVYARTRPIGLFYDQDDTNMIEFPTEFACFLPHTNRFMTKNPKAIPVQWGASLETFQEGKLWSKKTQERSPGSIVCNFNPTYSQTVRETILIAMESRIGSKLVLDKRHLFGEEYSSQLRNAQFCLAFGGSFHWPKTDYSWIREHTSPLAQKFETFPFRSRTVGVLRWDSFRFWESMLFGCIPIQLDFEQYGFVLPVLPTPWLHYIPIDLWNVSSCFERLEDLLRSPELLSHMAIATREWANEHYHPSVFFQRVIRDMIGYQKG